MKKMKIGTKCALAAAVCGLSLAVHPAAAADTLTEQSTMSTSANPFFTKADTDRNGFLSREEWRRTRGSDRVFAESDENRDGRLDRDEYVKASSYKQRESAVGFVDDRVLTAKVKTALVKEMKTLSVNVDTHEGGVLLSGFVDNQAQLSKALQIASSVHGVKRVHNGMVAK